MNKIKVLIVDDSAAVRKFFTDILSTSRFIEVVGAALDPIIAFKKIKKLKPDVLTLDIEMPRMDGLTFLTQLMKTNPMPVIMVSSLTDKGADATIRALEYGAIDFILKPKLRDENDLDQFARDLIEKIIIAGNSRKKKIVPDKHFKRVAAKHTADVIINKNEGSGRIRSSESLIALGASTGGVEVITEILRNLSPNLPGIVVVQHMPEKFTRSFAERVNKLSKLQVKEAENGDRIKRGMAFIAPGGKHLLVKNDIDGYYVDVNNGLPVNRHRPAVDVLFRSVSMVASRKSIGVLLTGMGTDGAQGMLELKGAGIRTIAQDEDSCTVFGMPAEAIKLGAVDSVKNVKEITDYLKGLGNRSNLR